MELPRKILIGYGVIEELSDLLGQLSIDGKVVVVTGRHLNGLLHDRVDGVLSCGGHAASWQLVDSATTEEVERVMRFAIAERASAILGLGGGKCVDVAKLASHLSNLAFISVPTSASHDGISSPFASIKGSSRPYSVMARPPSGILADMDIIAAAPSQLIASGCGDLVAKITAVRDWELARTEIGEYFGRYSASLALISAEIVLQESESIGAGDREQVRDVVEALISAGVAAGIAGSSRPCSGSEHLFSHAMDFVAPGVGLHGEKCGIGTIIMAFMHGLDAERIRESLKAVHAPTTASELGVKEQQIVESLQMASTIRPERYTILSKHNLDREGALRVARECGVV